eukprot:gb/GECH01014728.1/.p1 GENE.gb/GECH01014728.1/~~gb/GECH01014728.1/.p1  ORF type:complete len:256 (+),score=56.43 gb/GECH01014728.1/:1-768(+)
MSNVLTPILEEGNELVDVIFNYKTDHSQLEQVKPGMTNKQAVYDQNLELLEPQVEKMRHLYKFYNEMLEQMSSWIKDESQSDFDDDTLQKLAEVLDMVLCLDYVKTWQAGLNNDYSLYRRAKTDQDLSSEEPLRMFLIYPSNIIKGFREQIEKVDGYEKVIGQAIRYSYLKFREKPEDKFIRVAAFGIYLLEPILDDNARYSSVKRLVKPKSLLHGLQNNNNVNLYGKLSFNVSIFLKNCPRFKERAHQRSCTIL